MAQAFLLGRILVGCYYLQGAYHHFTAWATCHAPRRRTGSRPRKSPSSAPACFCWSPGCRSCSGVFPRLGVGAIVLFLVPVTLIMHPFWADRNLAQQQADLINFSKNIGLLGSSLMFLAVPRPWPYSLERRLRLPIRAPV